MGRTNRAVLLACGAVTLVTLSSGAPATAQSEVSTQGCVPRCTSDLPPVLLPEVTPSKPGPVRMPRVEPIEPGPVPMPTPDSRESRLDPSPEAR